MTDSKILQKSINKAIINGWKPWWLKQNNVRIMFKKVECENSIAVLITDKGDTSWDLYASHGLLDWNNGYVFSTIQPEHIIFDLDFAKTFWGEKDNWKITPCTCGGGGVHVLQDWHDPECAKAKSDRGYKFHLQKLVLEEDRIKYLEKFL